MVEDRFLSPGEVDIIETAKAKKKLKKEREELAKAKEELKPETIGRKLKKSFFTKPSKKISPLKKQKIFGTKPVAPDYAKEQNILREMFGHGGRVITNFDGRSLPKIHNTLNSGGGIIKSGDINHETARIFGIQRR